MQNQNTQPETNPRSLTSAPERFSDDAWNLLLNSEIEARKWRHQYLDVEHILQVLFTDESYRNLVNALPTNNSKLLDTLEDFLANIDLSTTEQLFIGEDLEILLDTANASRSRWGSKFIEISHILLALAKDKRIGAEIFEEFGLTSELLEGVLRKLPKSTNKNKSLDTQSLNKNIKPFTSSKGNQQISTQNESNLISIDPKIEQDQLHLEKEISALEKFGKDLTLAAYKGELDPVIGRDEEISIAIKVLSRRGKNNPVLIGSPGVGKTAIAELLAQQIINGEVPDSIKGLKLISLDVGALIAGTKFRGQFEERLRSVLKEVSDPNAGVVLFIDEMHTILGTERTSTDAGNLLKPILASGEIRCIGATTPENYRRTIEKDQALNRRFQQVQIKEPSVELSIEILRGIKERYENHHQVEITDQAVITANRLADRYINDRCLPDKAIDLIDEAAAQIRLEFNTKPKSIEKIELNLKSIETNLSTKDQFESFEDVNKIKAQKKIMENQLNILMDQWQKEKSILAEIKELNQEKEYMEESIEEIEQKGDLEEASRMQFDELHQLQVQINTLKNELKLFKDDGKSLIKTKVESEDIADVVARWTGIPVNKVLAGEKEKLLRLEKELSKKIIGQEEAVNAVAAAIKRARAGMKDVRRPIGSFLFLGPTGVGKTELAKTLAASLFDQTEALIRLDMSEFMERNAVARLIGAPPGYVGYEQGGQLTESIRRSPYSVVLLDEVEKAHPDVFNLLLQVLDDGRLTDSQGRTIDFRHTVVVMTSNLASRQILENAKLSEETEIVPEELEERISKSIEEALGKHFRPEFLNRIDEIIRFMPLTKEGLQEIIKLQISELTQLIAEQELELKVDEKTIEALALEAYEPEYGARTLRRILRRRIENPLATKLLEDQFIGRTVVRVSISNQNTKLLEFTAEN